MTKKEYYRLYQKAYREEHKERSKAYQKNYRASHKKERMEYVAANKEKLYAYDKKYASEHRERINRQRRERYKKNCERNKLLTITEKSKTYPNT